MNKTFASLGINASLVEALTNQHIFFYRFSKV